MSLEQKINAEHIQSMKEKNAVKSSTLSFLRAQLKNVLIDQRLKELTDTDVIAVIKKQIKQRQDSIEQYEKGNRPDLAVKEKEEMAILKSYLPQELSEDQVRQMVSEAAKEVNAAGMKDMGNVMKAVMVKTGGRADGKLVSSLVKEALGKL